MRGRTGYAIAVIALVAGVGAAPVILARQRSSVPDALQQIVVPGEYQLTFDAAGAHTIFYERRAIVGGRYFASDRPLSGLQLRLTAMPQGDEIAIRPPAAHMRYAAADREGSAIAAFTVPAPGMYRMTAWYPDAASGTTAVVAIGHGVEGRLTTAVLQSLAAAMAGVVACVGLGIATYVRRQKAA